MAENPALSSEGCRFDPSSWQLVIAIVGTCGLGKIVYDWWYKTNIFSGWDAWECMSVSLDGYFSNRLSVFSVKAELQNVSLTESVRKSQTQIWTFLFNFVRLFPKCQSGGCRGPAPGCGQCLTGQIDPSDHITPLEEADGGIKGEGQALNFKFLHQPFLSRYSFFWQFLIFAVLTQPSTSYYAPRYIQMFWLDSH